MSLPSHNAIALSVAQGIHQEIVFLITQQRFLPPSITTRPKDKSVSCTVRTQYDSLHLLSNFHLRTGRNLNDWKLNGLGKMERLDTKETFWFKQHNHGRGYYLGTLKGSEVSWVDHDLYSTKNMPVRCEMLQALRLPSEAGRIEV